MSIWVPKPEKDGLRIYGRWAGNQNGFKERRGDCVWEVHDNTTSLFHQCSRKRGHGPGGEFCKQHAKLAIAPHKCEGP